MVTGATREGGGRRIPGEPGIWVLVGGDLFIFSIFFLTFAYYRALEPAPFAIGKADLGLGIGVANTLLLLTGSLFVATGVETARHGDFRRAATMMRLGALTGLLFLCDKAIEWTHLIMNGHSAYAGDFTMLYFCFTGIHGLHVVIASTVLLLLSGAMRSKAPPSMAIVEACGLFWHVVDLLWIVLFALFYLAA